MELNKQEQAVSDWLDEKVDTVYLEPVMRVNSDGELEQGDPPVYRLILMYQQGENRVGFSIAYNAKTGKVVR